MMRFVRCVRLSTLAASTFALHFIVFSLALHDRCVVQGLQMRQQQKPCQQQQVVNFREMEKQILDNILGPLHYDRRIRPAGANGTGKTFALPPPPPPLRGT